MATQPTVNTLAIVSGGGTHGFGAPTADYRKDAGQTDTTSSTPSVFYELYTNNTLDVQFGLEFKFENNVTTVYCLTDNNSGNPHLLSIGSGTKAVSVTIAEGDTLSAWHSTNGSTPIILYTLNITAGMLWTPPAGGGGTSTEDAGLGDPTPLSSGTTRKVSCNFW